MTEPIAGSGHSLAARHLTVGFKGVPVIAGLDIGVPDGRFTAIVGANGSGKSTLLKTLARIIEPDAGTVMLDGRAMREQSSREIARRLGLLPQASAAPEGLTVEDLVWRGRFPHQHFLRRWTEADKHAVAQALALTDLSGLATRRVDELSGGQRQRAWIAMALAQQTPLLLLDEPTTYLDIAHQIELLELFAMLVQREGRTVVAVLHDLNHACRYADHLVAMKNGAIVAEGPPAGVMTEALVEAVFGLAAVIIADPLTGTPLIVPRPGCFAKPLPAGDRA